MQKGSQSRACLVCWGLGVALFVGCGDPGDETPWVGTWRLIEQNCNATLTRTGTQATTLILGEKRGSTRVQFTNGCTVVMEDYLITPDGDEFLFPTSTSTNVTCDPNPCTGETTVSDGTETLTQTFKCPEDFPPTITSRVAGRVKNGFIETDFSSGNLSCTLRYAKE